MCIQGKRHLHLLAGHGLPCPLPRAYGVHNCIDGYECQNENGLIAVGGRLVCAALPDAAALAPVVCRPPPALWRVALSGSQPYMDPASQDNRISISPVITSHAMQGLPPSLLPSIIRSLARSFVCCLLSVASVVLAAAANGLLGLVTGPH